MSSDLSGVADDLAPTGVLRASINLGNPVLASGTVEAPTGVTVDLAREVARVLGLEVGFVCFDAARLSFEALTSDVADIGFLAVDPARAEQAAFTAPYALIEGVFVVAEASPYDDAGDVDRAGTRVGVKQGSAYDLHLTRELARAEVVRGVEGVDVYAAEDLDVGAGIRGPVTDWAAAHPGHRVLEPAFMQIRQGVAVPRDRSAGTLAWLSAFVEDRKADGFVAASLARSGRTDAVVAPPA